MKHRKPIRLFVYGFTIIVLILLGYQFAYGKLFPYSPVVFGFTNHEMKQTNIYVQNGCGFDDFVRIDTLLKSVEEFHQMKFKYKPEIYIFTDSSSFIQRSISKARLCVYYNSRLFISPWAIREADSGIISLDIYLRHELSHSLIFQHAGLINAYKYPEWLLEGIAIYSSNQMGTSFYPGKEEVYQNIKDGNFMPPHLFKTAGEDSIPLDVKYRITFMYSQFACIVDYLVTIYGKDKFLSFMKKLIENNNNDEVFMSVYGIDFSKAVEDFKKHVFSN